LSHAMGIAYSLVNDDQPQELKEDEVPNTAVIIECFMGLAETHPLTGIVTLRAADIEQRIRKHWDDFFGHGSKVQNTELCLAYLLLDAFSNGACDQIDALGRRLEHYPFLHHASRYWGSHAREDSSLRPIDEDSTEMCTRFLEKRANLDSALQVAQIEPQLRDALHRGEWPDLDLSLEQYSSISSLQIASRHGLTKVVQKMIQSGDCAVSEHDCHGTSALHEAAGAGWEDTVNILLEAGAQPFLVDDENNIPLFYAATNGHFGIVSILKNQRGNAPMTPTQARDFVRTGYSQSVSSALEQAFYNAADAGKIDVVNRLLQDGVSPDSKRNGKSALLMAVNGGHEGVIQLILEKSADLSCPDRLPSNNIPLHQAIACSHVNIATMLLEYGANIETRDDHQRTALFESLSVRGLDGAALLLSEGIDMSATDCFGDTVLHQAAARGLVGHVMRFIDQGMEVNSINNEGWTPLHFAADRGDERTVELLVQSGADVNIADFSERAQWTPLMIIVSAGNDRLCKLLLRKCNVDESNMREAVTEAALEGHAQVLEMLLQECEDTDADLAALDLGFLRSLAENNDDSEIELCLRAHGA